MLYVFKLKKNLNYIMNLDPVNVIIICKVMIA